MVTGERATVQSSWCQLSVHDWGQIEGKGEGRWDPREINAEELDAAILEHAKQAFVAGGIAKLHFVKSTDKDLGGWKRKDYNVMRKDVVCYRYMSSCVS